MNGMVNTLDSLACIRQRLGHQAEAAGWSRQAVELMAGIGHRYDVAMTLLPVVPRKAQTTFSPMYGCVSCHRRRNRPAASRLRSVAR